MRLPSSYVQEYKHPVGKTKCDFVPDYAKRACLPGLKGYFWEVSSNHYDMKSVWRSHCPKCLVEFHHSDRWKDWYLVLHYKTEWSDWSNQNNVIQFQCITFGLNIHLNTAVQHGKFAHVGSGLWKCSGPAIKVRSMTCRSQNAGDA